MSHKAWLLLLLLPIAFGIYRLSTKQSAEPAPEVAVTRPRVHSVGPRRVSNQTSNPLSLYGESFAPGMRVKISSEGSEEQWVSPAVVDERHAYVRLSPFSMPRGEISRSYRVSAEGQEPKEGAELFVVNDAGFVDASALCLSPDGKFAFATSTPNDLLYAVELSTRRVAQVALDDGPSALACYTDASGQPHLAVTHLFSPKLLLMPIDSGQMASLFSGKPPALRTVPAFAYASSILVDGEGKRAFVAEQALDSVAALSLPQGELLWRTRALPNPRAMALAEGKLWVGSLQAGEVQSLDAASGKVLSRAAPKPNIPIQGGRSEPYSKYVMGGKAPRALAYSSRLKALFVTSIGPNVGPNPDRMEVSMNGGVSEVDVAASSFRMHRGFGAGIPEGMALDDGRGLLYVADVGLGRVRVLKAKGLAPLAELPLPPPPGFPSIRPPSDLGVSGRAGVELHSGPTALALSGDKKTLYSLNRFTARLVAVDVASAARGKLSVAFEVPLADPLTQPQRRLGQILYYTDVGRTGMSCDACHLGGHTEGVFFAKTRPLRIYRSPTLRGALETPPYFTPASTHSMGQTSRDVGNRNRFQNPKLTPLEIENLTLFSSAVVPLPNPFVGADGAPLKALPLPDEGVADAVNGLALFEGKAQCAACHPAPHFATDQDLATRGKTFEVGTPRALPLRLSQQDVLARGFAAPSLIGGWDIFPMLTSGAAGLSVAADGSVVAEDGLAIRRVLKMAEESEAPHGQLKALSAQEKNDLLGYLLSL